MPIVTVPRSLRDFMPDTAGDGLLELLNEALEDQRDGIIELVEERFVRRVQESESRLNERITTEISGLRSEMREGISGLRGEMCEGISGLRGEMCEGIRHSARTSGSRYPKTKPRSSSGCFSSG